MSIETALILTKLVDRQLNDNPEKRRFCSRCVHGERGGFARRGKASDCDVDADECGPSAKLFSERMVIPRLNGAAR